MHIISNSDESKNAGTRTEIKRAKAKLARAGFIKNIIKNFSFLTLFCLIILILTYGVINSQQSAEAAVAAELPEEQTSKPEPSPTPKPSSTIRPVYIPDPAELQDVPEMDELTLVEDMLQTHAEEKQLTVSWQAVEDADYYLLCALDESGGIYHKDILWAEIEEWFISDVQSGSTVLLCYKDMGEDSAEDDALISALYAPVEIEQDDEQQIAADEPAQNKYYIVVDKEDFTLAVFTYDENAEYTNMIASYSCALGRSSRMTPVGTYEISSKGPWKYWTTNQYSPYYTKMSGGLFIHGAIYSSKRLNSLLYKSYDKIGTAATSGCVRTTIACCRWIYYNCPAGTVVEIVESSDLIDRAEKPERDPENPRWDPTDPAKPGNELASTPVVTNNTELILSEGSQAALKSLLTAEDEFADDASLLYTVTTPPVNGELSDDKFTQSDIDAGLITYTHNGGNNITDSFTFSISNGTHELTDQTFSIRVLALDDDAPTVFYNAELSVIKGESASLESSLRASDTECSSTMLVFIVVSGPSHGSMPISFTQEQLLSGEIAYTHNGDESETDSFKFIVSDGINMSAEQTFIITVNQQ